MFANNQFSTKICDISEIREKNMSLADFADSAEKSNETKIIGDNIWRICEKVVIL